MIYNRRSKQTVRFALMLGFILCVVALAGACKVVNITTDEVHQRIKSELPPGSTYSQVTDFLKKYDWGGKSELLEFEDFGTLDDMLTEEEKRTIKLYSTGGIREVEKHLFGGRGIYFHFYYDQQGKLVTYKLQNYGY